jgi:hypothetical protein
VGGGTSTLIYWRYRAWRDPPGPFFVSTPSPPPGAGFDDYDRAYDYNGDPTPDSALPSGPRRGDARGVPIASRLARRGYGGFRLRALRRRGDMKEM